jgi:hypothetical protein
MGLIVISMTLFSHTHISTGNEPLVYLSTFSDFSLEPFVGISRSFHLSWLSENPFSLESYFVCCGFCVFSVRSPECDFIIQVCHECTAIISLFAFRTTSALFIMTQLNSQASRRLSVIVCCEIIKCHVSWSLRRNMLCPCLIIHWRQRLHIPPKRWEPLTRTGVTITQKITIHINNFPFLNVSQKVTGSRPDEVKF